MFMWVMALCEKRGAWPKSENECTTVAHSTATQANDGLASHAIGFVTTGWRRRDWSPISGRRSRWVGVPRDRIVHLRSRAAHAASPPAAEQVVAHRTARHANVA